MSGTACALCGGLGQVYDGPAIAWRPCGLCASAIVQPSKLPTCRNCRRPIRQVANGDWLDRSRNPTYCPHAVDFLHIPREGR